MLLRHNLLSTGKVLVQNIRTCTFLTFLENCDFILLLSEDYRHSVKILFGHYCKNASLHVSDDRLYAQAEIHRTHDLRLRTQPEICRAHVLLGVLAALATSDVVWGKYLSVS